MGVWISISWSNWPAARHRSRSRRRLARRLHAARGCRVGYLSDAAFCFYYPENLDALRAAGARLVAISPLTAAELPAQLDALYIGGGFPETHA